VEKLAVSRHRARSFTGMYRVAWSVTTVQVRILAPRPPAGKQLLAGDDQLNNFVEVWQLHV